MEDSKAVNYAALGKKIRQKRLTVGLSQSVVSESVELSESFYGHIERGDRKPSIESIIRIANFFDLSLDYLLLESKPSHDNSKNLQAEFENLFRDKSQAQSDCLLKMFKLLANNIDNIIS